MFELSVDDEIKLKAVALSDGEAIYQLVERNRAHLRAWLPWVDGTKSVDDTISFIQFTLEQAKRGRGVDAGIWYRGELAGVISLNSISSIHQKTEIGYWIGEQYTGKGIMTRACREMINYAFNELKLHRVEIRCAEGNLKSRGIPVKLGLTEEGRLRDVEYLYDHFVSHIVYGVLKDEWKGITAP